MIIDGQDTSNLNTMESRVVQFYKDLFDKWGVIWGAFNDNI
jgi:hypothetical protein